MGLSSSLGSIERLVDSSSTPIGLPELIGHADGFELQKFHETCEAGSAGREAAAEGAVSKAAVAGPTSFVHRWRGFGPGAGIGESRK